MRSRDLATLLVALARVKRKRTAYAGIHRAADAHLPRMREVVQAAIDAGRAKLGREAMRVALTFHDEMGLMTQVAAAIDAFTVAMAPMTEVLVAITADAGTVAADAVKRRPAMRANATATDDVETEWVFDRTSPEAVAWANAHAAELVGEVNESTRKAIRQVVEDAFVEQFDVDDLADEIENLIGDANRAELIARTEVMTAANEGQMLAWDQATEAGLLTGTESKEWIVTPDDRLCPVCEPLDGVTVPMDGTFNVDGDHLDGPPAHPRCRCVLGLTA